MPFWNKNALPPELRDLPAEEIAARLKKAADDDKKVTDLAAEVQALKDAVAGRDSQVTAAKDAVERLKKLKEAGLVDDNGDPIRRTDGGDGGGNGGGDNSGTPGLADWLADPQAAFTRASQPLAAATLISGAMTAKIVAAEFIQKQDPVNRKLWRKYEGEVQQLIDKLPAEQRIFPQTWINQFTFVKGIHLDEVVKEAQGMGDAFFAESTTPGGTGFTPPPPDDKITPEEEKVMRAMKIKPEDWIKRRKAMKIYA